MDKQKGKRAWKLGSYRFGSVVLRSSRAQLFGWSASAFPGQGFFWVVGFLDLGLSLFG